MLPGVYQAKKKDNTIYFRSSITYSGKHISLGSFDTEEKAHEAYLYAGRLLAGKEITLTSYKKENPVLSFSKWVSLINFRDNGIYITAYAKKQDRGRFIMKQKFTGTVIF